MRPPLFIHHASVANLGRLQSFFQSGELSTQNSPCQTFSTQDNPPENFLPQNSPQIANFSPKKAFAPPRH